MFQRILPAAILSMALAGALQAQVSQEARFEIVRTVLAEQAAARVGLPFGGEGVEVTDAGVINQQKLDKEIEKNGQSIEIGKIVTLTDIQFSDKSVEIELDGGGKNKRGILERIQVGIGGGGGGGINRPVGSTDEELEKAKGSKITLRFANKISSSLTPDELKQLLSPVLDFNKQNFMKTGVDSLPPEFREAVLAKEARIGMDRNTVLMALGRPNNRVREPQENGVWYEDWIYAQRGFHRLFVTFNEEYIVIRIKEW
jgi:hypothetical protein